MPAAPPPPDDRPPAARRRLFLNPELQIYYVTRSAGMAAAYFAAAVHVAFLAEAVADWQGGADVLLPLRGYPEYLERNAALLLAGLALLPALTFALFRQMHRVAGPLVQFRHALTAVRKDEPVGPIRLREGDLLSELREEFNACLAARAARRGEPFGGKPAAAAAAPAGPPTVRVSAPAALLLPAPAA